MKRIVIFEGIASSGKTTLERVLNDRIKDSILITEGKTLMPIFEEKDSRVAADRLLSVLDEMDGEVADTVIIDRLHLTQAFRTRSPVSCFQSIEQRLLATAHPFLVLLSIQEEAILARIKETDVYRAGTWIKKKQGTYEERTEYYKEQQSTLKREVKESLLPVLVLDTTDKDWDRCLDQILEFIRCTESD